MREEEYILPFHCLSSIYSLLAWQPKACSLGIASIILSPKGLAWSLNTDALLPLFPTSSLKGDKQSRLVMQLLKDHQSLHWVSFFPLLDYVSCSVFSPFFLRTRCWFLAQITVHFQNVTEMWETKITLLIIHSWASKQMQLSGKDLRNIFVRPWEF